MKQRHAWLAAAALLGFGCGGSAEMSGQQTDVQSTVRAAQEIGAEANPEASLHLQYAKDQLERANQLAEEDEESRAERMLERAKADAELAIALAQEASVRTEAENLRRRMEQVGW